MPREHSSRSNKPRPPLDAARLEALAIHYVGRYATTKAKLVAYLRRKLRERGWEGEAAADPDAIGERCAALGYIDDRAFASARASSLARRGYGARRLKASLREAGVAEPDAADAHEIAEGASLAAALALARRRRIGPFAAQAATPDQIRRSIATLVRAGHDFALARRIAQAAPEEEIEEA